jgi:DNA invertase Pin-like site-specific DNA recombinase
MGSTAAIYCRISADAEGRGLGVQRQQTECEQLAERLGLTVGGIYTDNDISAFSGKRRPSYERLLEDVKAGIVDHILAWHPDRLHRSPTELERFIDIVEAAGAQVATVQGGRYDLSTASGRMTARIVGAVGRHESEHKSERIRSKVVELIAAGAAPGGRPPYGYRRARTAEGSATYEIVEAEAGVLRQMVDWAFEGRSMLWIARTLEERGVRTRLGSVWNHGQVNRLLRTPAIAGLRSHHGEVAGPGAWPALIERGEWEALQAAMTDPNRKARKSEASYPLSGLLYSPSDVRLIGRAVPGPTPDSRIRTYVCPVGATPPFVSVSADRVEEFLAEAVLQRFDEAVLSAPAAPVVPDLAAIESELAEWGAMRGRNEITAVEFKAGRVPLIERYEAAKRATAVSAAPTDPLLTEPGALRRVWDDLPDERRRRVFDAVFERIVVLPVGRGSKLRNVEDRLDPTWRD